MHGDYNQFMHPIINFNTLCISQGILSTFSMDSVAFFNYCRVWFCETITVTMARLVLRNNNRYNGAFLRNNNRYNGAFGFAQQLPLQRRVWFCATITVTMARLVLRNNKSVAVFNF